MRGQPGSTNDFGNECGQHGIDKSKRRESGSDPESVVYTSGREGLDVRALRCPMSEELT